MITRKAIKYALLSLGILLGGSLSARAEQSIGVFYWQVDPYCDVVVLQVDLKTGTILALHGYDDVRECGDSRPFPSLDGAGNVSAGTLNVGLTYNDAPDYALFYATLSLTTLSGTWWDDSGESGTLILRGPPVAPASTASAVLSGKPSYRSSHR